MTDLNFTSEKQNEIDNLNKEKVAYSIKHLVVFLLISTGLYALIQGVAQNVALFVFLHILLITGGLYYLFKNGYDRSLLGLRKDCFNAISVAAILGISVFILIYFILLNKGFRGNVSYFVKLDLIDQLMLLYRFKFTFVYLVLGAIFEEIVFRAVIFKNLYEKYSPLIAMLFTSLLFSLLHFAIGYIFFLSILLCWLYKKFYNLPMVIGVHLISNCILIFFQNVQTGNFMYFASP